MPSTVVDELIFQYDNLFHVLGVTIRRLSRKQWSSGKSTALTPARLACHILWACEFYATGDGEGCVRRFGCRANSLDGEIPAEQLPSVAQTVDYIEEVKMEVRHWLSGIQDANLLERTPAWGWRERGTTLLGHLIYVLRHATFHLGQLCAELEARGIGYGVFK